MRAGYDWNLERNLHLRTDLHDSALLWNHKHALAALDAACLPEGETTVKTSVCYCRCSGKSQIEGDSFERQMETIHRCAVAQDSQIIQRFDEQAVPGKTEAEDRPAWNRMLAWM